MKLLAQIGLFLPRAESVGTILSETLEHVHILVLSSVTRRGPFSDASWLSLAHIYSTTMSRGLARINLSCVLFVVQFVAIASAESSLVNAAQLSDGARCDVFLPSDQMSLNCSLAIDEEQGVNHKRVWRMPGNSSGAKFTITLPEVYPIEQIWLQQGYDTNDKNIKTIDITAQNGTLNKRVELTLRSDGLGHEIIKLSPPVETNILHILIVDVYSAESSTQTIISDIQLLTEIDDRQLSTLPQTELINSTSVGEDDTCGGSLSPAAYVFTVSLVLVFVGLYEFCCRRRRSKQVSTRSRCTALSSFKDLNGTYYKRAVEIELGPPSISKAPPVPTPRRPIPATPPSPPARRPSGYPSLSGECAENSHHDSGNKPSSSGDGVDSNTNDRESQQDHNYKKADGSDGGMTEELAMFSEDDKYQDSSEICANTASLYNDTIGPHSQDGDKEEESAMISEDDVRKNNAGDSAEKGSPYYGNTEEEFAIISEKDIYENNVGGSAGSLYDDIVGVNDTTNEYVVVVR